MRKVGLRQCAAFALGLCIWLLPAFNISLLANEKANQFIKTFQQFAQRPTTNKTPWLSPASPWAPYFNTFKMRQDSQKLAELERHGRCDEVMTLIFKHFVRTAPDLREIFLKPEILNNFEHVLIPHFSPHFHRCKAWQKLTPAIEASKRRSAVIAEPFLNLPPMDLQKKSQPTSNKLERSFFKGLRALIHLGLCLHDKAALKDINALSKKLYVKIFDETEALYMDAHAKRQGLITNHYSQKKQSLAETFKAQKDQISLQPQKVLSMKARIEAEDWQGAARLVPHLSAHCQ